jgi:hypothetical protein
MMVQVLYGEEEEIMMAESKDPVIQQIWTRKIVSSSLFCDSWSLLSQVEAFHTSSGHFNRI